MSALWRDFHFLRPWWLLALAALPWLWQALSRSAADGGGWRAVVDAHLLPYLLDAGEGMRSARLPAALAAFAWLVACLALAGPAWERLPQPVFENRAARVFALDLGASMSAQDIKPSRYERARFKLDDMLARSRDMQTALIAYAGDAFVVAPLTDDVNTVTNLVDALDPSVMPSEGNDAAKAIDLAVKLIGQAGLHGGQIVLLADSADGDAVGAARRAHATGVRVSVLGVGTDQGAPVALAQGGFLKDASGNIVLPKRDAAGLRAVARAGGGDYAGISADAADIDSVLAGSAGPSVSGTRTVEATTERYLDRGPWLILLLVPLAALGFRRGWLASLPLVLLAHAAPAQAFSWRDLWQRPDQQARAQLDAGHAQQAQTLARDPALRGAAAYRAGDFASAASEFSRRTDAQAQYNRGNALAMQQQYEQAIAAYDQALKQDPQLADAKANKQAIEDWLKQQQQSQQDQKQGEQGQKQDSAQGKGDSSAEPADSSGSNKQGAQQKSDGQSGTGRQGEHGGSPQDAGADKREQQSAQTDAAQASAQDQDKARQAEREAGQQFGKQMDAALQRQGRPEDAAKPGETKPVRLGAREEGAPESEHDQAVEQWLQRVPDDPGGLLRRKFRLEYETRRNGGQPPQDDGR